VRIPPQHACCQQTTGCDVQRHSKYLGVTLDRTLTFKSHLEKAEKKMSSRVNLVRKLAGTKWGSNAQTLRMASLALVYSSAEYCAPVWLNGAQVHKLDVKLKNVMRLFTGTVKSTELQWFPVLSNIAPPKLRREAALCWELKNRWINGKSLLFEQLQDIPALRLRSRNPIWIDDPGPTNTVYDFLERWREMWSLSVPVHGDLVRDPTVEPPGFDLRRREWVLLNRLDV
jgi:hypothetical protein